MRTSAIPALRKSLSPGGQVSVGTANSCIRWPWRSRHLATALFAGATAILFPHAATLAQTPQQPQAVQLPTVSQFSVSTSVLVPDSGSGLLGSSSSARSGGAAFGPSWLPRQSFGPGMGVRASPLAVTATIHDFASIDRQLLSVRLGLAPSRAEIAPAAAFRPPLETGGFASVAELKQRQAAERTARDNEARDLIAHGQRLAAEGKTNLARIYYQMALRRASTAESRAEASASLSALGPRPSAETAASLPESAGRESP